MADSKRTRGPKPIPAAVRFSRYVNYTDDLFSCWLWTGGLKSTGYGEFQHGTKKNQKIIVAHRFAWTLAYGPIPDGMFVLHRCDVPRCVRPDHLFLGTHAMNMADMVSKGRSTRCRGTKLTPAQVTVIRTSRDSARVLGARYGIHPQTIRDIWNRKRWTYLP